MPNPDVLEELSPERALIFRIAHINNVPFILKHGVLCRKSEIRDTNFESIGNAELIERRAARIVPCDPGGTLADYVPFYFTPCSPMMYNIKTGYNGVTRRSMRDLVVLVSSVPKLVEHQVRHLIADRHAALAHARFSADSETMIRDLDWERLRSRNFRREPNDPGRFERYEAEALVYRQLPRQAILGLACNGSSTQNSVQRLIADEGIGLKAVVRSHWFF